MNQPAQFRQVFTGRKFIALFILGLCEFVRGALLFFILPIYVRGVLDFSSDVVGYAIAAHYTLDTGLRSFSGWFTDRFGQRKVLLTALSLGWVGLWIIVLGQAGYSVIIGSALLGLGMATVWPAVISRVTEDLAVKSQATAMGGVIMAWLLGAGAGTVSMSWLLGDHVGPGFVTLLLVWLLGIFLSIFAMRGFQAHQHLHKRLHIKNIYQDIRGVRLLFPGMFVQTFAMGLLLPILVLYARYQLGLDGKMYSYLLISGGAATVLLQIPIGRLVDRYGYKRFLVPGFALSAVMLPIIVSIRELRLIYISVAGLGMAYALILPSWNSVLAHSVSEKRRGVMWGVFMTVEGLGMAVGPLVGGMLANAVSITAPFYVAAGILMCMTIFYCFAPLERVFRAAREEQDELNHVQGL